MAIKSVVRAREAEKVQEHPNLSTESNSIVAGLASGYGTREREVAVLLA